MDFSRRKLKVLKEKEYNHQPKRLNTRLLEASGVSDGQFAPNISRNTPYVPPIDFSVPPPQALVTTPEFPRLEDERWRRFQEEEAMKRLREEFERQQAQREAYDIAQRLKEMEEYKKEQEEQQRQREAQELFKAEEERKREALFDEQRQIMRQETEDPEEIAREQDQIREMMDREQQEDEIIDAWDKDGILYDEYEDQQRQRDYEEKMKQEMDTLNDQLADEMNTPMDEALLPENLYSARERAARLARKKRGLERIAQRKKAAEEARLRRIAEKNQRAEARRNIRVTDKTRDYTYRRRGCSSSRPSVCGAIDFQQEKIPRRRCTSS
jgi:hypothetical protein